MPFLFVLNVILFGVRPPGLGRNRNILDQLFEWDLLSVRGKLAVTGKDRQFCRTSVNVGALYTWRWFRRSEGWRQQPLSYLKRKYLTYPPDCFSCQVSALQRCHMYTLFLSIVKEELWRTDRVYLSVDREGVSRTECWGEYLDLRGKKGQEDGENCGEIFQGFKRWSCPWWAGIA